MSPPRGNGPLISILMPTRKRPQLLMQAVRHFLVNTVDHKNIEFVFRYDDDDHETGELLQNAQGKLPMTVLRGPRGRGYLDMHHWVNGMCSVAKGDWIFVANDDAALMSYGWDKILENFAHIPGWHGVEEISVLGCYVNHAPAEAFLLVRREVVQVMGHYARHHLCDNYMWKIARFCESANYIPIHIHHMPREEITDETGREVMACHGLPEGHKKVVSSELSQCRLEDAQKIINYLRSRGV